MPFETGKIANPAGRPVGAVNKATSDARAAIAAFVDGNADRLNGLLDKIELESPKAAFDAIMSVVEYHIPKLARAELTGKDGKDLFPSRIELVAIPSPTKDTNS